jgi:hypothetical protein
MNEESMHCSCGKFALSTKFDARADRCRRRWIRRREGSDAWGPGEFGAGWKLKDAGGLIEAMEDKEAYPHHST